MDAGDRRRRELAECRGQRRSIRSIREHSSQTIKRNGKNEVVEYLFLPVRGHTDSGGFRAKRFHARAQLDLSATLTDVIPRGTVEVGKGYHGNSHAAGSRGF